MIVEQNQTGTYLIGSTAAVTHGSTASATGANGLDTRGAGLITLVVSSAAAGAGTGATCVITTADTTNGSTTAVKTITLAAGTTPAVAIVSIPAQNVQRYLNVSVTPPSGSTNSNLAHLSVVALTGRNEIASNAGQTVV